MKAILCMCVVFLYTSLSRTQFVTNSPQSTTDGSFRAQTGLQPPKIDIFSPPQSNFPFAQNGFNSPAQPNLPIAQNDISTTQSNLPLTQNGFGSGLQSNLPITQNGFNAQTQSNPLSQNGFNSPWQSNITTIQNGTSTQSNLLSQNSVNSPTETNSLNQNGLNTPTQSNSFSQNRLNSPTQSNPFSQNSFNSPAQSNPFPQNGVNSSTQSNPFSPFGFNSPSQSNPFSQNNVTSTAAPVLSPTQNDFFSTNQLGPKIIQNEVFPQTQTDAPPSQAPPTQTVTSSTVTNSTPSPADTVVFKPDSLSSPSLSSPIQSSAPLTHMQFSLATMLAGQFSNEEEYRENAARNVTGAIIRPLINVSYIPVVIQFLLPAVTFYYEQQINGKPSRQAIYAFKQESPCQLRMSTYDIANASRFSSTPEGLEAVEKLTSAELQNRPVCDATWEFTSYESFTSYLSSDECTFEVAGRVLVRPSGSRNLTCSGMTFTEVWRRVRDNQIVGGSLVPYILKKIGNIYPVPVSVFSSNACFRVPCTNSGGGQSSGPGWSDIKQQMSFTKKDGLNQNFNGM